jgi:transporter family-2 protein
MALTLQVALNGQLRSKVGSPVFSAFISFLVGAMGLGLVLTYTMLSGSYSLSDSTNMLKGLRWWMLTGGLLGAFYIFVTIFASPKIGFANMFSLIICGQLILSIVFEHFGIFQNQVHLISPQRIFGVVLLIAGVVIIQKF